MLKKSLVLLIIFGLVFSFVGCTSTNNGAVDEVKEEVTEKVIEEEVDIDTIYPLTIIDGMDREVILEKEPSTIVSVAPSVTETVYALGMGEKLIGRTDYCDYPEEALSVESIGSLREVNLEKITELNPDIVLASTHFKEETLNKLNELGIKVAVIISQENFEGVYSNIELTGKILNANEKASEIVEGMKATVREVTEKVNGVEKVLTYYVVGYGEYGDWTATGDTFISNMIELAGGENAAKDGSGWKYSLEKLVEKNPQVMICGTGNKSGIEEANGYKDLDAVKNGKLSEINDNSIYRMGPRLSESLLNMAKIIHPELFK